MWQWEVRGVAVREGGEIDIQLDKSTHNQWLAYLNGDSILCLTKSDLNSWVHLCTRHSSGRQECICIATH